jgi:hypothetical protein
LSGHWSMSNIRISMETATAPLEKVNNFVTQQ